MASNPSEGATPVDRVPAFIIAAGPGGPGGFAPGNIDVAVSNGSCVLSAGRKWVVLNVDELGHLLAALVHAESLLTTTPAPPAPVDPELAAHARRMVEGLGLEWPTP